MNRLSSSALLVATVMLGGAMASAPAQAQVDDLTGTVWELQTIRYNNDTTLEGNPPSRYTIEFMEDGSLFVRADCNNVLGSFTTEGDGSLEVTLGPSTLVACPPDSINTEYVQGLDGAAAYFVQDGDLYIDLMADTGTLQFSPAAPTPEADASAQAQVDDLTGTVWELQTIRYNNDTTLEGNPPSRYTIEFMEDGSLFVKADCNNVLGSFTAEGAGSLEVTLGQSTRVGCPPDSIATEYVQGLDGAATYFVQDGDLYIDIMADTGTMQFSPAPMVAPATEEAEPIPGLW